MRQSDAAKLAELRAKTDRQLMVLFSRNPNRHRRLAALLLATLPPGEERNGLERQLTGAVPLLWTEADVRCAPALVVGNGRTITGSEIRPGAHQSLRTGLF